MKDKKAETDASSITREVIDISGSYGADENYFASLLRSSGKDEQVVVVLSNIFANIKMQNDRLETLSEVILAQGEKMDAQAIMITDLKEMYALILKDYFSNIKGEVVRLIEKISSYSQNDTPIEDISNELRAEIELIRGQLGSFDVNQFERTVHDQDVLDSIKAGQALLEKVIASMTEDIKNFDNNDRDRYKNIMYTLKETNQRLDKQGADIFSGLTANSKKQDAIQRNLKRFPDQRGSR